MAMWTAAAELGGAVLGGLFGKHNADKNIDYQKQVNAQSQKNWEKSFQFNKDLSEYNKDYQKHRFQYGKDSMVEAGLNPLLMGTGASGIASNSAVSSSAPSGPSLNAPKDNSAENIYKSVDTATSAGLKLAQGQIAKQQLANVQKTGHNIDANTLLATTNSALAADKAVTQGLMNDKLRSDQKLPVTGQNFVNSAVEAVIGKDNMRLLSTPEGVTQLASQYGHKFLDATGIKVGHNTSGKSGVKFISKSTKFNPNAHIKDDGRPTDD